MPGYPFVDNRGTTIQHAHQVVWHSVGVVPVLPGQRGRRVFACNATKLIRDVSGDDAAQRVPVECSEGPLCAGDLQNFLVSSALPNCSERNSRVCGEIRGPVSRRQARAGDVQLVTIRVRPAGATVGELKTFSSRQRAPLHQRVVVTSALSGSVHEVLMSLGRRPMLRAEQRIFWPAQKIGTFHHETPGLRAGPRAQM